MSLKLATPIPAQVVVRGSTFSLSIHVHDTEGNNFNWSGYNPKGSLTVGSTTTVVTGTVIQQQGGTASVSWTATQTAAFAENQWGVIVLYADPTANSENRHIATIFCRIAKEATT